KQNEIRSGTQARSPCLGRVFGKLDRVPFVVKDFGQEFTDTNFVVNNQNSGHKASPTFFPHHYRSLAWLRPVWTQPWQGASRGWKCARPPHDGWKCLCFRRVPR